MFGGYTEVAAYYVSEPELNNDREEVIVEIPPKYLPSYSTPDAWHQNAVCQDDFIMIAEFCEQEGPKPLITIPRDAAGDFDLNDFAVRIMSIDYQTSPSQVFSMAEDHHVIITEGRHGVHACVHHFTLHDSQARGFVRPFCMSYVTPDQSKLMSFYDEMTEEFARVSHCFKYGNLMVFVEDMTHYLSDLLYTKDRLKEWQTQNDEKKEGEVQVEETGALNDPTDDTILQTLRAAGLDHLLEEVRRVLDSTSNLLNDPQMELRFKKLEEKCSTEEPHHLLLPDMNHYSSSFEGSGPEKASKPLKGNRRRRGSFSDMEQSCCQDWPPQARTYQPHLVHPNPTRRFDRSLRTLHELCQWGAKEGLNRLRCAYKFFSRETSVLLTERKESRLIEPSAALISIGRNVVINFLTGLGIFNSEFPCDHSQAGGTVRRWLSEETLTRLQSAAVFPSSHEKCSPEQPELFRPVFLQGESLIERDTRPVSSPKNIATIACDIGNTSDESGQDTLDKNTGHRQVRGDRHVDQTSHAGHMTPDSRHQVSLVSTAQHVDKFSSSSPGCRVLEFVQQHSFSVHVMFTLLTGRTLVIVGSVRMEPDLLSLLNTLRLFVPGHHSGQFVLTPWLTHPLHLTDLSTFKLVALGRPDKRTLEQLVPSSVKKYVSILDWEKKTLWSPPYHGGILTDIYNKRKVYREEKAYIAYMHGVLFELAMKAFVYFHSVSTQIIAPQTQDDGPQKTFSRAHYKRVTKEVLSKLKLNSQDGQIVQYFVEIFEQQQLDKQTTVEKGEESPVPSITLDHCCCTTFKD